MSGVCVRCKGTGIEPNTIYREGKDWLVHPSRTCPVCRGPIMLGNPALNGWHCANVPNNDTFVSHFAASMFTEQPVTR